MEGEPGQVLLRSALPQPLIHVQFPPAAVPQCSIDLKANVLRFGTTGNALAFLPEHEIPQKDRLDLQPPPQGTSPQLPQPGGRPQPSQEQGRPGKCAKDGNDNLSVHTWAVLSSPCSCLLVCRWCTAAWFLSPASGSGAPSGRPKR